MEQINGLNYQYQLLRYRHDQVTGEFANIGLVYFDPATRYLKVAFEDKKYGRLTQFFGDSVQGNYLITVLRQLKNRVSKLKNPASGEPGLARFRSVQELTSFLLPPDDNGLYFSEVWNGWHFEHDLSFNELYDRIIGQYQEESTKRQDDSYAWKNIYKKHFDQYNLTPKLHAHKVATSTDAFDFRYACKNGVWHCIQSLSFDLKHEGSIKDKIYRWDGIARELLTAKEPMKVYLLSIFPESPELTELLQKKLNVRDENVEVRVVGEAGANAIALELKAAMDAPGHR